ncbi:hypothetical protein K450DRAFT_249362 [Umbelopsis ramanniana AG]|uniref:Uncharacterized protein n=1 Tax=Umbelopsis ramanniana AG TaxID=1314678 RepID=A0AAD5E791_UMBRA|nr:uncharacterized protein K450DRAFT_249362 [Umbelopsis ramanniana AG]KAI8577984.1 hypothetical protein K450DRAFT_249362 [Umbelopsis ramanniana AG]
MASTLKQTTSQRKRSSFVSSYSNRTVSSLTSSPSTDPSHAELNNTSPAKTPVKSQKKPSPARSPTHHIKSPSNKAPWRPPGRYQIPDILKASENTHRPATLSNKTNRSKKSHLAATLSSTNKIKHSPAADSAKKSSPPQPLKSAAVATPLKRPWIPVGKSPQVLPLPALPAAKTNRPHALFDTKMRKTLPPTQSLGLLSSDVSSTIPMLLIWLTFYVKSALWDVYHMLIWLA